jgi:hypothetical protein
MGLNLNRWIKDRKREVGDVASRSFDQVNMFDNGLTAKQRTATGTGNVIAQVRDKFDANSSKDRQIRSSEGRASSYRQSEIDRGNKRPYESLGAQLAGNTARFINTADYAGRSVADTISGDLTRQRKTRERFGQADSGLLGAGTIFDNPEEMTNLGNAEIIKRTGLTTAGTAAEILPFARVSRTAGVGAKAGVQLYRGGKIISLSSKAGKALQAANLAERGGSGIKARVAFNAGIDTASGVGESAARQYAQTGKVDGRVLAGDTLASVGMGQIPIIAGAGFKKGTKEIAKKTNPAYDELLKTRKTAQKAFDVEKDPKVRKEIGGYLADLDREIRKEAGIIPKTRAAGPGDEPINVPNSLRTKVQKLSDAELKNQIDEVKKTVGTDKFDKKLSNELNEEYTMRTTQAETSDELADLRFRKDIEDRKAFTAAKQSELDAPVESKPKVTAKGESVSGKDMADRYQAMKASGMSEADIANELDNLDVGTPPQQSTNIFKDQLDLANAENLRIIEDVDAEVRAMGFEPSDIKRKANAANRGEYELTDAELAATDKITNMFNEAREIGETQGLEIPGEQIYYVGPQVKKGQIKPQVGPDPEFGYKKSRQNLNELDDIDVGNDPALDYMTKAKNRPLMVQSAIQDAANLDGRKIAPEKVVEASEKIIELQKKVKDKSNSAGVLNNDTLDDLYKIGKDEGYNQADNTYNPTMFTQEPKTMLESAGVYKNGFEQFDNSAGYAGEFVDQLNTNKIPDDQVAEALEQSIRGRMPNADASAVNSAVDYAMRRIRKEGFDAAQAASVYERAFTNVAKSEILRTGKTTRFTDGKMRKVMNEQMNGRLLFDSYKKNLAQEADSFLAERINVSLRGGNILSAAYELGDVANIYSKYGLSDVKSTKLGLGKIDGDRHAMTRKYGQSNAHFASNDIPEITKMEEIWGNPNTNIAKKIYESYRTGENKLLIFKYVEEMKTELFFRTADKYYKSQGLEGGALVDKVMEDYLRTMLPSKLITANRIVGKVPRVMTQYLNWSLQATKRLGRTVSGSDDGGKFAKLSRPERIARGVATEIAPKVLAAAAIGVPIMQLLGMRDFTGATEGDFTGIDSEDKEMLDTVVGYLSLSPALSTAANFYFADRRNDIANERASRGETYRAEPQERDQPLNVAKDSAMNLVPFRTQAKKINQVREAADRGYFENRDGRIQAEAPTSNAAKLYGAVVGKNNTEAMRDYQNNPSALSVVRGQASPLDLITKNQTVSNVVQNVTGEGTRDYKRPLSGSLKDKDGVTIKNKAGEDILGYSDTAKQALKKSEDKHGKGSEQSKAVLRDWIKDGRDYNKLYDNFKKIPGSSQLLEEYYGDNIVTPEKWRLVQGDEKMWSYLKDRKQLEARDLGREIDPIYRDSLDDGTKVTPERAKLMLQERATTTGEDMRQREMLYRTDWYGNVKDAETAYYKTFSEKSGDSSKTQRVIEWNNLSEQAFSPEKGLASQDKYKSITEYNNKLSTFENYDSDERKAFTKSWYNSNPNFNDLKINYELERLGIVNKMRKIEGADPLTEEQFLAKFDFPTKDDNGNWTFSKYGSGSGGSSSRGVGSLNKYKISTKGTFNVSSGSPVKSSGKSRVSAKKITKPKVSIKKSRV